METEGGGQSRGAAVGTHMLGWPQSSPLWSVCTAGDTGVLQSCQHRPPRASRPSTPVRIRYPHIQITIRSFTSSAYRLKLPEHEAQRHSGEINEFFSPKQHGTGQEQPAVTAKCNSNDRRDWFSPIFLGKGGRRDARWVPPGTPHPWANSSPTGQKEEKLLNTCEVEEHGHPRQPRPLRSPPRLPGPFLPRRSAGPRYVPAGPRRRAAGAPSLLPSLPLLRRERPGCGTLGAQSRCCSQPKPHPCPRPPAGEGRREAAKSFGALKAIPVCRCGASGGLWVLARGAVVCPCKPPLPPPAP